MKRFNGTTDGRGAALVLMAQYKGDAEVNKRCEQAKKELSRLYYKRNEQVYLFSKFAAKLQEIFTTIAELDQAWPERDQVQTMLERMQVEHHPQLINFQMTASTPKQSHRQCKFYILINLTRTATSQQRRYNASRETQVNFAGTERSSKRTQRKR